MEEHTKPNKLQPTNVKPEPITEEYATLIIPDGHVLMQPLDSEGGDFGEPSLIAQRGWDKIFSKAVHSNGKPKYAAKKKGQK